MREAALAGDIGERAVTVVAEQHRLAAGHEEIEIGVVIEVDEGEARATPPVTAGIPAFDVASEKVPSPSLWKSRTPLAARCAMSGRLVVVVVGRRAGDDGPRSIERSGRGERSLAVFLRELRADAFETHVVDGTVAVCVEFTPAGPAAAALSGAWRRTSCRRRRSHRDRGGGAGRRPHRLGQRQRALVAVREAHRRRDLLLRQRA